MADIPAGILIGRLEEPRAMSVGRGVLVLSLVGGVWSPNPIAFGAFMFLMGCGESVWLLARSGARGLCLMPRKAPIKREFLDSIKWSKKRLSAGVNSSRKPVTRLA